MRRDDEIVAVELEVAHRCHWHIQLERLPVVAIVERDVDATLSSGHKQAGPHRIFLDDVYVDAGGKPLGDFLPAPPHVARAIDVWIEILELMTIRARVRRALIEMR